MSRMQKATRVFAFLAFVIILVGCSSPTVVVPPTADIPAVRTESAQTVVARLTIEAALNPTATLEPTQAPEEPPVITATPMPSPTQDAAAATLAPTATLIPTARPAAAGGTFPTRTPVGPDVAQLISQEPFDGTKFRAGEEFDARWTIKNVGTATWNINYDFRAVGDKRFSRADLYSLPQEVKPGESVTLIADMVAPGEGGTHVANWELVNQNGAVFFRFYSAITVE